MQDKSKGNVRISSDPFSEAKSNFHPAIAAAVESDVNDVTRPRRSRPDRKPERMNFNQQLQYEFEMKRRLEKERKLQKKESLKILAAASNKAQKQVQVKVEHQSEEDQEEEEVEEEEEEEEEEEVEEQEEEDSDEGLYEIENILKIRLHKDPYELRCYIKWKGYPNSSNTWEPIENIMNSHASLKDYYNANKREKTIGSSDAWDVFIATLHSKNYLDHKGQFHSEVKPEPSSRKDNHHNNKSEKDQKLKSRRSKSENNNNNHINKSMKQQQIKSNLGSKSQSSSSSALPAKLTSQQSEKLSQSSVQLKSINSKRKANEAQLHEIPASKKGQLASTNSLTTTEERSPNRSNGKSELNKKATSLAALTKYKSKLQHADQSSKRSTSSVIDDLKAGLHRQESNKEIEPKLSKKQCTYTEKIPSTNSKSAQKNIVAISSETLNPSSTATQSCSSPIQQMNSNSLSDEYTQNFSTQAQQITHTCRSQREKSPQKQQNIYEEELNVLMRASMKPSECPSVTEDMKRAKVKVNNGSGESMCEEILPNKASNNKISMRSSNTRASQEFSEEEAATAADECNPQEGFYVDTNANRFKGCFSAKDEPIKVLGMAPHPRKEGKYTFLVAWYPRKKKEQILDSWVDGDTLKLRFPQVVFEYYESSLKFIS